MNSQFRGVVVVSAIIICCVVLLSGCGGGGSSDGPSVLTTIQVSPSNFSLQVGETQAFTAVGKDQYGDTMVIQPTWTVTGGIGSLDQTAGVQVVFSGDTVGEGTITATVGDIAGSANVTVTPEPAVLARVEITPDPSTLEAGETQEFSVVGYDQYDNTIAISSTASWSVTGGIGTVLPAEGLSTTFTAVTAGTGTVAVLVDTLSDAAAVTVTPAPIYVPDDYDTIQGAINASSSGDIIIVRPGTYYEHIDFEGKDVVVQSTDPLDPTVVASTIIDGSTTGTQSVVRFYQNGSSAVLEGFTITGGTMGSAGSYYNRYGSGIIVLQASPTIRNNIITGNTTPSSYTGLGGGIFVREGAPTIQDNKITWNETLAGGGIFLENAAAGHIISGNTISNNTAQDGGGIGTNSALNLSDNTIEHNTATRSGGGIHTTNALIANGCTISNNQAISGGGIWLHSITASQVTNSVISDNVASQYGGGIFFFGTVAASLNLTNTTISSNSATNGGGVYLENSGTINCASSTFTENNAYAIEIAVDAIWEDGGGNTFANNLPDDFLPSV